jgi:hypothetical protein
MRTFPSGMRTREVGKSRKFSFGMQTREVGKSRSFAFLNESKRNGKIRKEKGKEIALWSETGVSC